MQIAAVTPTSCSCGWSGDLCFSADKEWRRACPGCKKTLSRDGAHAKKQSFHGNRRFSGAESVSVSKGFHPKEVKFVQKRMPRSANLIRRNGDVVFNDRAEEKTFSAEFEKMANSLGGLPGKNDGAGMIEVDERGSGSGDYG